MSESESLPTDSRPAEASQPGDVSGSDDGPGSNGTHPLLQEIFLVIGLVTVLVGLAVWITPQRTFAQLIAAMEGQETIAQVAIAIVLVSCLAVARVLLPTIPVAPEPATRTTTRTGAANPQELAIQPGIDIDGRLAEILAEQDIYERHWDELTEDIRRIAIETLCYTRDIGDAEATMLLESGEWTDDPLAATLFMARADVPFRIRFYRWLSPRKAYRREIWAAVRALRREARS